ncbi:hypothetical protein LMH73_026180 [Vibrio splendidus]|nr:hypothetical protein [Vibrio splendidus]MCC4880477.1 hypothetical protein [Vibrio splendidus]
MHKKIPIAAISLLLSACATVNNTESNNATVTKIKNTDICYMSYSQHLRNGHQTKSYQVDCGSVSPVDIKEISTQSLLAATLIDGTVGKFVTKPPLPSDTFDEQPDTEVKRFANGVFYFFPTDSCYRSYGNKQWDVDCSLEQRGKRKNAK